MCIRDRGRVDRLTCTAQLLYEVEDPARYLQPDVVGDFSGVQFAAAAAPDAQQSEGVAASSQGPDRVAVSGASGHPRPEQLKVCLLYTSRCV